ncbi:CheR family methyltransferase [Schlesneria paludicola]|uniref:CheR family methyltransferase n=1 Tax=Schlesneria paludicola TaxID=360056 RepID=UPI0002E0D671|nr:protein-glutamate O-methyltransferase CheR [Schlesneria paludicola]
MDVSPQEFREVQKLVRSLCGLVLTDDKMYLVKSRLESVVRTHGLNSFAEYLSRVVHFSAVKMRDELVEALTTGETSFNRDGHPFEALRRQILPELEVKIRHRRQTNYPVPLSRIWSAGCSTGQEPYSIAMAILDYVAGEAANGVSAKSFPILATDVSARNLNIARAGRYTERELDRGVTMDQKRRFFHRADDGWDVNDSLRSQIEFRRLNFMDPVDQIGPFDMIFCRNVLIYFDDASRQRLCDLFHRLLSDEGMLILGAAENLYGLETDFQSEPIGGTYVYRKHHDPSHGGFATSESPRA